MTITATDADSGLHTTPYSFDDGLTWQTESSKVFTSNQTVNIKVRDAVGNTTETQPVVVDKLDTNAPIINSVTGNPTDWTDSDVTLTVTASDSGSGLHTTPYSFDDGVTWEEDNSKTFTSNQTVKIKVRDTAGNTSIIHTEVISKIDTTKPTITSVTGNQIEWTSYDISLTVVASDIGSGLHTTAYSFDNGVTWQAEHTKTFSSNQELIVMVRDSAGNISLPYTIEISKIDKTNPTILNVDGNTDEWNISNITLTVSATDVGSGLNDIAYSFDNGTTWQSDNNKAFATNQTVKIKVRDKVGNTSDTYTVEINKVDTSLPIISSITGNHTNWSNEDVTLTIGATDTGSGLHDIPYSFDNGATWQIDNNKVFTSNQVVNIQVRDKAGNTSSQVEVIHLIDKLAPIINSIDGNTTDWTDSKITLTVDATDTGSGLHATAYSFDDGATWQTESSKTFTSNQTVNIKVRDTVVNTTEAQTIVIDKLDSDAPIINSITGNPIDWTDSDVTLTVTATDTGSGLHATAYSFDDGTTWQADNSKVFTTNKTVKIKVRDAVGNTTEAQTVVVDKLDSDAPIINSVTGNPIDWSTDDATLLVTATDAGAGLHATAYSFNDGVTWQVENSKTFTSNQIVKIKVRDTVGNTTETQTVVVDKLDSDAPLINSITGNPTDWTDSDVTLTVTATDTGSGLHAAAYSFDDGTTWQTESSKTFTSNQIVKIKARDTIGNTTEAQTVVVYGIDTDTPIINSVTGNPTDWTDSNVTLTVNATDTGSGLHTTPYSFDDGTTWQAESSKIFTSNKTVKIKVRDAVGNLSATNTQVISMIDTTAPIINSIAGNPIDWSTDDVTLTVNATDEASGLHAIAYSFDDGLTWQTESSKTFSSNQTVKIKTRDKIGNVSISSTQIISKIDKTPPVPPKDDPDSLPSDPDDSTIVDPDDKDLDWQTKPTIIELNSFAPSGIAKYQYQVSAEIPNKPTTRNSIWNDSDTGEIVITDEGIYIVKVRAISNVGNISEISNYKVRNDFTLPTLEYTVNGKDISVVGDDSLSGLATITCSHGVFTTSEVTCTDNTYGDHIYTVADNAGNTTTVTVTIANNNPGSSGNGDSDNDNFDNTNDSTTKPVPPTEPTIPEIPTSSSIPSTIVPKDDSSSSSIGTEDGIKTETLDPNSDTKLGNNSEELKEVGQNTTNNKATLLESFFSAIRKLWWLWLLILLLIFLVVKKKNKK